MALFLLVSAPVGTQSRGALVVVGGGGTTDAIVARTLAMAGGRRAVVAVLPQASELADAGDSSVKMWTEAGAAAARKVDFTDSAARSALERASLIWIPGGDQNRFMKQISGTGLDDVIRTANRKGTVVGGTSAGAAVMSARMMTGEADLQSLTAGATLLVTGLALWPEAIVDQHFLKRQRSNRLLSAVLDHPDLLGVGIDEGTAVIVTGERFEVIGRSSVVVVDARHAAVPGTVKGSVSAGSDLKLSVLRDGMFFSLK